MTEDKYIRLYRLGLKSLFVPNGNSFQIKQMSIYSNVIEQDMIKFRQLSEQQKKQQGLRIKTRILNQTHDINLEESLSPITKKLEEVEESSQKLGDFNKKTPQPSENIKHNLQSSQSRTPKLVSASDELVKTFGKTNDSKNFFK